MKARVRNGAYEFANIDLLPPPNNIVGTAQCEGVCGFHYKNTWVMNNVGLSTFDGIPGINGVLWYTPSVPFVIDYIVLKTVTTITGNHISGPAFSGISFFMEIDDTSGNHSILTASGLSFSGGTFSAGVVFTTIVNPGFVLTAFSLNGAFGGTSSGFWPVFHANGSGWFNKPLWLSMSSDPTNYTLSGTLETHVFGKILS